MIEWIFLSFFRDGGWALLLLHGGHISSATRRLEDTKDSTLLEVITQSDLHLIIAKSHYIPQAGLSFNVATRLLCDPVTEDPSYQPAPEDRPGGFQWGQVGMNFSVLLALLTMNHD